MHLFVLAAAVLSITPVQPPQPNRQPALASVPGLTALVFGSGNSIWFVSSLDNGQHFSPPTEVAQVPQLPLGRHRGPRVVISGHTVVVSAIYDEPPGTPASPATGPTKGDLVAWRSTLEGQSPKIGAKIGEKIEGQSPQIGGQSWSKPLIINDVPGSAREGLHAMAAGRNGEIAAVWLDLRAPGTRLYGAYSLDSGASWSPNVLLYQSPEATICQCCDPSLVSSGKNRFAVMFRNALAGSRDLYMTQWTLGGALSPATKVGNDSWKLNACPMDGGGIASRAGEIVTAWRRDQTVYLDKPGQPEVPLGDGKDVALALSAAGPYVAWSGASGVELAQPGLAKPVTLASAGGFPALLALPDNSVLAAWERDGQIELKRIAGK